MENIFRCEDCNRDFISGDALSMHNAAKHSLAIKENSAIKNDKRLFKKSNIIIAIIAIMLIVGFWFAYNSSGKNTAGSIVDNTQQDNKDSSSTNNEIQKITLSMKGNYYPNTIKVKANQPVEITLDKSVRGCFRSFNIKGLGVNEYSANPEYKITFTPNKKGSFEFACGMRMAYGTIIVE